MGSRPTSSMIVAVAAALVLGLVACGDDDDGVDATTSTEAPTSSSEPSTSSTSEPAAEQVVSVYFLRDEDVGPVARTVPGDGVAVATMEALLAGPTATEAELGFVTNIPAGTALLGVDIDGGVATVDLSLAFESGGGSLSMMARVTEVVYTLTGLPDVDAVAFELEGEPVEFLGGEGLELVGPQNRDGWRELAPAILVESPRPFEDVTSPLRVTGESNTFEATFQLTVADGDGLIVYEDFVTSTGGNGRYGAFDVTVEFDVPRAGVGAVIVFELSAEDGSQINVVEVPVRIS